MPRVVGALAAAALARPGRTLRRLRLAPNGAGADDRVGSDEPSGRLRAGGALAPASRCLEAQYWVVRCPWTPFLVALTPSAWQLRGVRVLVVSGVTVRSGDRTSDGRLTRRARRREASYGMVPIHCSVVGPHLRAARHHRWAATARGRPRRAIVNKRRPHHHRPERFGCLALALRLGLEARDELVQRTCTDKPAVAHQD